MGAVAQTSFSGGSLRPNPWKHWLPPWPVVPPRLWATAVGAVLAVFSLVFQRELWPHTPGAVAASGAMLLLALVAAGPQVAAVLWRWPAAYAGPRWLRVLFWAAARGAALGLLVLEALCCLAALVLALACG